MDELEHFAMTAADACLKAPAELRAIVFSTDEEPGVLALPVIDKPPDTDGFFTGSDYAGMATVTRWSPDDVTPFEDAWLLVCVRRNEPAWILVGNEHFGWSRTDLLNAPWIALSTAGSLRAALEGKPMVWKEGSDERLFNTVDEEPPPVDAQGLI